MKNLLCVPLLFLSTSAFAQESSMIGRTATYGGITTVTMQLTDEPGALYEVVFSNRLNNNDDDDGTSLTYDGVSVDIVYGFNVNGTADDTISVICPPGYYSVPEVLQVMEGFDGTIYIYSELVS